MGTCIILCLSELTPTRGIIIAMTEYLHWPTKKRQKSICGVMLGVHGSVMVAPNRQQTKSSSLLI